MEENPQELKSDEVLQLIISRVDAVLEARREEMEGKNRSRKLKVGARTNAILGELLLLAIRQKPGDEEYFKRVLKLFDERLKSIGEEDRQGFLSQALYVATSKEVGGSPELPSLDELRLLVKVGTSKAVQG